MIKNSVIEPNVSAARNLAKEEVKAAVLDNIEAISANPKAASVFFEASTELLEGVQCSAQVRDFPSMIIDELPGLGGKNAGPNPVELLLVAMGTCQEVMYSAYASVMGINLESVKVTLKGDMDLKGMLGLDENIPSGYNKISFKTSIQSDADEETLMSLIAAVEDHCPVMDTILREITISGSAEVNGKELLRTAAKKARVQ